MNNYVGADWEARPAAELKEGAFPRRNYPVVDDSYLWWASLRKKQSTFMNKIELFDCVKSDSLNDISRYASVIQSNFDCSEATIDIHR
jgi:hypothetical protein